MPHIRRLAGGTRYAPASVFSLRQFQPVAERRPDELSLCEREYPVIIALFLAARDDMLAQKQVV